MSSVSNYAMTLGAFADLANSPVGGRNCPVYVVLDGVEYPVLTITVQNSQQAGVDWPKVWLGLTPHQPAPSS